MGSVGKPEITFNKVSNGHYESSDGNYTIRHRTGYKNVNVGKYSQKRKYDNWEVKKKGERGTDSFKTLQAAQDYIKGR